MKIGITGGTLGIGKALGDIYESRGHEIIRLSRRNGYNIQNTMNIADAIEPCDLFINNAQTGFAQTELLFEIARRWRDTNKQIIVISTIMLMNPIPSHTLGDRAHVHDPSWLEYYIQKTALEQAVQQIRHTRPGITLTVVRPGATATENKNRAVPPAADAKVWAETLVNIFDCAGNNFVIPDITLGPGTGR